MLTACFPFQFRSAFHRLINSKNEKILARHKWNRNRIKKKQTTTNLVGNFPITRRPPIFKKSAAIQQRKNPHFGYISTFRNNIHQNHSKTNHCVMKSNAFNHIRFTTLATVMKKSKTDINEHIPTTIDIHENTIGD